MPRRKPDSDGIRGRIVRCIAVRVHRSAARPLQISFGRPDASHRQRCHSFCCQSRWARRETAWCQKREQKLEQPPRWRASWALPPRSGLGAGLKCEYHLGRNTAKAKEEGACQINKGPQCRHEEENYSI